MKEVKPIIAIHENPCAMMKLLRRFEASVMGLVTQGVGGSGPKDKEIIKLGGRPRSFASDIDTRSGTTTATSISPASSVL